MKEGTNENERSEKKCARKKEDERREEAQGFLPLLPLSIDRSTGKVSRFIRGLQYMTSNRFGVFHDPPLSHVRTDVMCGGPLKSSAECSPTFNGEFFPHKTLDLLNRGDISGPILFTLTRRSVIDIDLRSRDGCLYRSV